MSNWQDNRARRYNAGMLLVDRPKNYYEMIETFLVSDAVTLDSMADQLDIFLPKECDARVLIERNRGILFRGGDWSGALSWHRPEEQNTRGAANVFQLVFPDFKTHLLSDLLEEIADQINMVMTAVEKSMIMLDHEALSNLRYASSKEREVDFSMDNTEELDLWMFNTDDILDKAMDKAFSVAINVVDTMISSHRNSKQDSGAMSPSLVIARYVNTPALPQGLEKIGRRLAVGVPEERLLGASASAEDVQKDAPEFDKMCREIAALTADENPKPDPTQAMQLLNKAMRLAHAPSEAFYLLIADTYLNYALEGKHFDDCDPNLIWIAIDYSESAIAFNGDWLTLAHLRHGLLATNIPITGNVDMIVDGRKELEQVITELESDIDREMELFGTKESYRQNASFAYGLLLVSYETSNPKDISRSLELCVTEIERYNLLINYGYKPVAETICMLCVQSGDMPERDTLLADAKMFESHGYDEAAGILYSYEATRLLSSQEQQDLDEARQLASRAVELGDSLGLAADALAKLDKPAAEEEAKPTVEAPVPESPSEQAQTPSASHNFCTQCGSKLSPNDVFCSHCGKKVG